MCTLIGYYAITDIVVHFSEKEISSETKKYHILKYPAVILSFFLDFDEKWRKKRADAEANALAIADFRSVLSHVERTALDAPQVILGRVYDRIGFNAIGGRNTTPPCHSASLPADEQDGDSRVLEVVL